MRSVDDNDDVKIMSLYIGGAEQKQTNKKQTTCQQKIKHYKKYDLRVHNSKAILKGKIIIKSKFEMEKGIEMYGKDQKIDLY